MDSPEGFFKPFNPLAATPVDLLRGGSGPFWGVLPPGSALLTLSGTPRKKRVGVWFHAFRIALC